MKKIAAVIFAVVLMAGLCACAGRYRVDYDGWKEYYEGAKNYYRAGDTVRLECSLIVTDADLIFYLDGELLETEYDDGHIIEFVMPARDVKLSVRIDTTGYEV